MTNLLDVDALSVAAYRARTGDTTSSDPAVTGALVEAESLLEEHLRRRLAWDDRTDSFRIYPDGRVYPDAWPITTAELTVDGRALLAAEPDGGPFIGIFEPPCPYRASVTWSGGFDDGSDSTVLPTTLAHAIYDLAYAGLNGVPALPSGQVSVSVGDTSASFTNPGSGEIDSLVPGLSERVRRYMNRWVG